MVVSMSSKNRATSTARRLPGGSWTVPGMWRPDEVTERIGVSVPEDGPYETLGGFVMERLGRVPRVGDEVEVDGWRLRVIAMDTRRVERLQLSPLHGRRAARTEASR